MAQERKTSSATPTKKTSSKKTHSAKKKRVYIPTNKIIIFCAIVVVVCSALLFASAAIEMSQRKSTPMEKKSKQEKVIYNAKDTQNTKNTSTVSQKAPVAKKNTTTAPKNTPSQKTSVPQRNTSVPKKDTSASQKNTTTATKNTEKIASLSKKEALTSAVDKADSKKLSPAQNIRIAADIPEIPVARLGAKLIVVFDDGGQNLNQLEKCISLPFPVTVAVLPKLPHSKASADKIRASGNEVILHQPMQALSRSDGTFPNPGPGAIVSDMPLSQIEKIVRENILEIGPVVGLNNHEGSAICEDESRITTVLNTAKEMGVFYLDSRTTSKTRVPNAAMSIGMGYYERNVFLDNTKKRSDIISEIMRGVSIANKTGSAIMIGHVWSAEVLPPILAELYPILKAKGYEFTTVSKSGALIMP